MLDRRGLFGGTQQAREHKLGRAGLVFQCLSKPYFVVLHGSLSAGNCPTTEPRSYQQGDIN